MHVNNKTGQNMRAEIMNTGPAEMIVGPAQKISGTVKMMVPNIIIGPANWARAGNISGQHASESDFQITQQDLADVGEVPCSQADHSTLRRTGSSAWRLTKGIN